LNYDQQFFRYPLPNTLKKNKIQKQQWLESMALARLRNDIQQDQDRNALSRKRNLMETWLGIRNRDKDHLGKVAKANKRGNNLGKSSSLLTGIQGKLGSV
jgi:hypothetical protein